MTLTEILDTIKGQPEWLLEHRKRALNRYNDSPLPAKYDSLWKHSNPEEFIFSPNGENLSTNGYWNKEVQEELEKEFVSGEVSGILTNRGGTKVTALLAPRLKKSGIITGSLAELSGTRSNLIEPYLGKLIGDESGKFEAFNTAAWKDGLFLYIPEGVSVEKPIYLVTHIPSSGLLNARNLVILEENASVDIIELQLGGPENRNEYCSHVVTETFSGQNAGLNHLSSINLNPGARTLYTHRAKLERDAHNTTAIAVLGGAKVKTNFGTVLSGKNAENLIYGFASGRKRQSFDHYSLQEHAAEHTFSSLDLRAVVSDRSNSSFRGSINIREHAPYSEAYQENKNLLLSRKARVESSPELEIKQDEVRCSHGATIGPPDEDQLFYLMSRGISRDKAIMLLVEGFLESSMQKVPENLKKRLKPMIQKKLKEEA